MTHPFRKRLNIAALLVLTLIVASGCVSARQGVSWPSSSLVGPDQNILLAYGNYMVQINPSDGTKVQLLDSEGKVRIDPDSGAPRTWELTESGTQAFYTKPLLIDDGKMLLISEYEKKFIQIDYAAARIETATTVPINGHPITDMVVDEELNRIYVGYNSANLEAFDRELLSLLWTFETRSGVWAKPLLSDGVLYFTSMDHFLYAVNPETGAEIWKLDLGGAAAGTPTLAGDHLYIGTFARTVLEISLDGEQTASYETANWVWGSPTVDGDSLYVADLSGFVYALSVPGLDEKWASAASDHGIRPSPLVVDDSVIVASRTGNVVWLKTTDGSIIQARKIEDEVLTELLLIPAGENLRDPLVIVTGIHAGAPSLAAFTVTTGENKWNYRR